MKKIVFTVTNDLSYDQRMIRICSSLQGNGYDVLLVGRKRKSSRPLNSGTFGQKRLNCFFEKGFAFYAEYNIRLFFFLLFAGADAFCCIDLDTMLPVYFAGKLRKKKRVYDAHEYFSEMKEVVTRPHVYRVWHWIEKKIVPEFIYGYTVSQPIAEDFKRKYGVTYPVIMNIPLLQPTGTQKPRDEKYILYQGAINEARGLEYLVPAMKEVDAVLHLYGDGNFVDQCKGLIGQHQLQQKVILHEKALPEQLREITLQAYIGINLVENTGLNQYYSLANKFFDYMHALVPQVTMDFPEYSRINQQFEVAVLISELDKSNIVTAINSLLCNKEHYCLLKQNCAPAQAFFNWQNEEKKLISFYKNIFE